MRMDWSVGTKIDVPTLKEEMKVIVNHARLFDRSFVLLERVNIVSGGCVPS